MSVPDAKPYAGDISVEESYELLKSDTHATLVDVRTEAEWQFVGAPDLTTIGKTPVFLQWQTYPTMTIADDFVADLAEELRRREVEATAPVVFLCRSGARSRHAAVAMTQAGWSRCYNIAEGFEGALDPERHRGKMAGWRARGLPWTQS